MGRLVLSISDYDGERSTVTFPASDLQEVNITAQLAAALTLQNATMAISRGKLLTKTVVALDAPQGVGRATSPEAQREEKALVRYYDATSFERATLTIAAVDMSKQNPDYPGVFYLAGAANNDADWEAFVTAFEAYVPGPGGNVAVVEEIIHVGRDT